MNNSNSNTFSLSNETLLLINILNSMYNNNLRQINNLIDNLNNSNNEIINLLIQILHGNQGNRNTRRNNSRRLDNNSNNINYNDTSVNRNSRNFNYLISEYTIPINRNTNYTIDDYSRSVFENFLQPIQLYPSQSQIEAATRRVRYCDISRPINTSCPISMDEFNDNDTVIVIRHCGHTFHNQHIMNWFRTSCRCPVCRYDIREYNSNVSNMFFNDTQDASGNNIERNINNTLFDENITNNVPASIENNLFNNIFDPSGNYINNRTVNNLHNILNILNNRNQDF